jgi:hypothetical protein
MEVAHTAGALGAAATRLTVQIKHFRAQMKTRPSVLNRMIRYCYMVESDVVMIVDDLETRDPTNLNADGSWRMLGVRLQEMKELLDEVLKEMGQVNGATTTTPLGTAMLQMTSDDHVLPEIKRIQEELDWRYRSMQVWMAIALE